MRLLLLTFVVATRGLLSSWLGGGTRGSGRASDSPPSHRRTGQARVSERPWRSLDSDFSELDLPPLPSPPEDSPPPAEVLPPAPLYESSSDDDLFLPPREDVIREGELGGEISGDEAREGYWASLYEEPGRLRASDLNEVLQPDYLDRLRFNNFPMMSYGALFQWEVLVRDAIEVYRQPWALVAAEHNLPPPDDDEVMRAIGMRPERAIQYTFRWTDDWGETQKLAFEHYEKKADVMRTLSFEPAEGALEWLTILNEYQVPTCACAGTTLDRAAAEHALTKAGLHHLVSEFVTVEDGCETAEQSFLVSCVKLKRPPERCVVFSDESRGIIDAHEATCKAVGVITPGSFGGDLRSADVRISGFDDLSLMTMRELFKGVPVR